MFPAVAAEFVPHGLGNEYFVSIGAPAGAPGLVKRVGAFVNPLVSAVKDL